MDAHAFDTLTRQLSKGLPRRSTLALVAGAISPLLIRARPVEAACKKVGKKCDKNKDCCDGAKCAGKKCKCKADREDCDGDGACERVTNDDLNCGACGAACPEGEHCRDGSCETCVALTPVFDMPPGACSSDAECCGNGLCCTFAEIDGPYTGCFDLLTHTTACGLSCDAIVNCLNSDQICTNGECVDA